MTSVQAFLVVLFKKAANENKNMMMTITTMLSDNYAYSNALEVNSH